VKLRSSRRRMSGSAVAKHVRFGLGLFLFLLIYDGALRKWVLPSAEQLLFIAKDALLMGLLVYAMLNRPRKINVSMQPAARALLLLYAAWVLLETGNLNLPSVFVGIWGLKAHLLYASLILLLPLAFSNLDNLLRWLVKAYPWVVVPVCALAFVQLASPPGSFINQQVRGGMDMVAYFGESGLVRVTGTFSYITGMASFVQTATVLGMALFLGGARSRLFLVGFGFALAALPATGSRGVIAVSAVAAVMMLFAALASRLISTRMAVRIVVVIAVLGAISLQTQDAAWVALQQRTESAAEISGDTGRSFTAFTNALSFFDTAGYFGFGSGSANMGAPPLARTVEPFSWLPAGIYFEEESGRLVLELGMFGWLFSQAMRVAIFFWSAKLAMNGRTRSIRLAAVLALPVMALGMYQGNGVFSPPIGAAYYWFCVALLAMAQHEHRQALLQRARQRAEQLQAAVAR
jgi:hypothetical protein